MRTIKVVLAGIVLFAAMAVLGRWWHPPSGLTYALLAFIPLWLACSIANLRVGVTRAGYTVREEMPILVVVFLVPVVVATLAWAWF